MAARVSDIARGFWANNRPAKRFPLEPVCDCKLREFGFRHQPPGRAFQDICSTATSFCDLRFSNQTKFGCFDATLRRRYGRSPSSVILGASPNSPTQFRRAAQNRIYR